MKMKTTLASPARVLKWFVALTDLILTWGFQPHSLLPLTRYGLTTELII
jgi:hypothetical protein